MPRYRELEVETPDAQRMSFWSSDLDAGEAGEASTDNLASWLRDVGRSAFGSPYEADDPYATVAGGAYTARTER